MQGEVVTQAFPEEVTFHQDSKDEQQLASSHPVPMTTEGWLYRCGIRWGQDDQDQEMSETEAKNDSEEKF